MNPTLRRRQLAHVLALALAATAAAGTALPAFAHGHNDEGDDDDAGLRAGKVFVSSNAPAAAGGNKVLVYARAASGPATLLASVATQGNGTGAGLGSQGAVALSTSGRFLFVVNAASNTLSTFEIGRAGLTLASVVNSGGLTPISVAESDGLVYVLNAGGSGNVVGFRNLRGTLTPLSDGSRGLSANTGTNPAQVGFDNDGDVLVVSEKGSNRLTSYSVRHNGTLATSPVVTASAGSTPFGFAITRRNVLVVSEAAASTVSSYRFKENSEPAPQIVSPAVANGQGAACWIAVTPNGRYAYSANAATSNISSYAIGKNGALTLLAGQAGTTTSNGALDMSVTPDGKQLYALAPRAPQQIVSFTIAQDGSLAKIGALGGVPAGAAGLVAN